MSSGAAAGKQDVQQLGPQCAVQRPRVGQFPARHATPEVAKDTRCRLDAHVGHEKTGFEFLQHLFVDGAGAENEVANAVAELAARVRASEPDRRDQRERGLASSPSSGPERSGGAGA